MFFGAGFDYTGGWKSGISDEGESGMNKLGRDLKKIWMQFIDWLTVRRVASVLLSMGVIVSVGGSLFNRSTP